MQYNILFEKEFSTVKYVLYITKYVFTIYYFAYVELEFLHAEKCKWKQIAKRMIQACAWDHRDTIIKERTWSVWNHE